MQRCSERMAMNIRRMFLVHYASSEIGFTDGLLGYENGNVWQSFIRLDTSDKQRMRIPIFLLSLAGLQRALRNKEVNEIIVPVNFLDSIPHFESGPTARTGDNIIKMFSIYTSGISRMLMPVKTNSGSVYYGCTGAIFNSDKVPLFMPIATLSVDGREVYIQSWEIYIHPSVFYTEDLIEKCIVNKILPFVLSHPIALNVTSAGILNGHQESFIPKVIVKDITKEFLYDTIIPKDVPSKEELDQLLINHIDEVNDII